MFHNGTLHHNLRYKEICPLKEKEQVARISFMQSRKFLVYLRTMRVGQMAMEEINSLNMTLALWRSGIQSKISWDWEILKLFFISHNIAPVWTINNLFPAENGNLRVDLVLFEAAWTFQGPLANSKSYFHITQSVSHNPFYIWSRYPLEQSSTISLSEFSFDAPSTFLFFIYLFAAVALMKTFTHLGSKLGLESSSEEPVLLPTRF